MATAIRKGPFQTNLLLGGYDTQSGASLYWLDYMGAMSKVGFGAHGYAGKLSCSVVFKVCMYIYVCIYVCVVGLQ